MEEGSRYTLVVSDEFISILRRLKKKPDLQKKVDAQVKKILREPLLGKPLRNVLRNYRRVHIESYVLMYEVRDRKVRLVDFDHHDNIYKKYS